MAIYPIKLQDKKELVSEIKARDLLIFCNDPKYADDPNLLRSSVEWQNVNSVTETNSESVIVACYGEGVLGKMVTKDELINGKYWWLVPFPKSMDEKSLLTNNS